MPFPLLYRGSTSQDTSQQQSGLSLALRPSSQLGFHYLAEPRLSRCRPYRVPLKLLSVLAKTLTVSRTEVSFAVLTIKLLQLGADRLIAWFGDFGVNDLSLARVPSHSTGVGSYSRLPPLPSPHPPLLFSGPPCPKPLTGYINAAADFL